ncbi:2Fe-2S iron-sulfur cluster-binding protein [Hydrogenimonas sp. SS33]|uniref:succinate dehydrogenase/fumarate reductase iron-sulfur subunit n=1 Tax=Hydrogenimonas leucolamina TaxID=2954236 RepID=UPI00336BB99F
MITIQIRRFHANRQPPEVVQAWEVEEGKTLLEVLGAIKNEKDPTLTFRSGCRSSVCGSCAVRVNGREVLACAYKPKEGDLVEPLRYGEVIKDLVTDQAPAFETLQRAGAWLEKADPEAVVTPEEEKRTEAQSDCILCHSCYSACPVLETNPAFLGPFALTRDWRYVADPREADPKGKIDAIQRDGVWDCTLCGECTAVCPQGIDPKNDILMLRTRSIQMGHMDPNMGSFGSFGLDF